MGNTAGIRTRRYHAYLIVAAPFDERRYALVNDIEVWIDAPAGTIALSSHRYAPNVVHPDGATRLIGFDAEPWPTWRFDIGEGLTVIQQLWSELTGACLRCAYALDPYSRVAISTRFTTRIPTSAFHPSSSARRAGSGTHTPACRPSSSTRTQRTGTIHCGFATSHMPRSEREGWTTSKTWRRRAS
jgi:hypothetical protein